MTGENDIIKKCESPVGDGNSLCYSVLKKGGEIKKCDSPVGDGSKDASR